MHSHLILRPTWWLALVALAVLQSATASEPISILTTAAEAPTLDGDPTDACWQSVEALPLMMFDPSGKAAEPMVPQATVKVVAHDDAIYALFEFAEPAPGEMTIKGELGHELATEVWLEDHWELFIGEMDSESRVHLMGDPTNRVVVIKAKLESMYPEGAAATRVGTDAWTAEIRIPAQLLDTDLSKEPAFRFNAYRTRRVEGIQLACWAPVKGRFSDWERFGWLPVGTTQLTTQWLKNTTIGPDQAREIEDVRHVFLGLETSEEFTTRFTAVNRDVDALTSAPESVMPDEWLRLATRAADIPERLHRLWEDAKLLEIIHSD